ncbi:MAG TPA: DUF6166 domain-containing protein [Thermoanaerobaculia bacterium]|nr:DUF6166 domain-containing protein [Thermoanaerobaculia bacterium]
MPEPTRHDPLPTAYRGRRTPRGAIVEAQTPAGAWHRLDPRLDLRMHSPTGFEWGYGGSGPAQLALALAASRLPDDLAHTIHQRLKWTLVATLDGDWHLPADRLDALLAELVSARIAADLARCPRHPGSPLSQKALAS